MAEHEFGPDDAKVGTALDNVARLYWAQGRYAEAEPLYKRALAIGENALGPDHPAVGNRLRNLASLYEAQGRYAEAEPLYKRALAIAEEALRKIDRAEVLRRSMQLMEETDYDFEGASGLPGAVRGHW